MVTPDNARCLRSCPHQRYGKTSSTGEVARAGNWQYDRRFCQAVEDTESLSLRKCVDMLEEFLISNSIIPQSPNKNIPN